MYNYITPLEYKNRYSNVWQVVQKNKSCFWLRNFKSNFSNTVVAYHQSQMCFVLLFWQMVNVYLKNVILSKRSDSQVENLDYRVINKYPQEWDKSFSKCSISLWPALKLAIIAFPAMDTGQEVIIVG